MSRPGVWVQAWRNFLLSLKGSEYRVKQYVGVDKAGNRFYEYETTRLNVKRGFDSPEGANYSQIVSPEWRAWLNNTRRLPPSDEEILLNETLHKKRLQQEHKQDIETSRRAPFVDSKGKGAADIDRTGTYPVYKDIEISAGVKSNKKN